MKVRRKKERRRGEQQCDLGGEQQCDIGEGRAQACETSTGAFSGYLVNVGAWQTSREQAVFREGQSVTSPSRREQTRVDASRREQTRTDEMQDGQTDRRSSKGSDEVTRAGRMGSGGKERRRRRGREGDAVYMGVVARMQKARAQEGRGGGGSRKERPDVNRRAPVPGGQARPGCWLHLPRLAVRR